jgi:hypothetical protein
MTTHGEPSAWHEREDGYRLSGLRIYEYRVKPNGNSTPDTETIDHSDGAPQELHQAQNDQTPTDDTKSRGQSLDCHSDHIQVREKHDQSHTRELSIDRIPPLLFRWWNRDSQGLNSKNQFLAGIFRHRERFDPKDITGTEFKAFFRRHVTKQEVATPFISTFSFPLAPFHRALTGQKGAMVSIIDTSKVTSKIFYAHPLAAQTRTFTHSWKGYAEYLVWGQIPAEAIVSTLDINSVGLIAQLNRDINRLLQPLIIGKMLRCNQKLRDILAIRRKGKSSFRCGLTLRKLLVLLQVPRAYWQDFASKFAHCWGWKYAQEKREFLDGVLSKRPYSQDELSDSESEWVMPTPQTTSKKASNGISSDLDEEDGEPLEYEEQELSDLERKSETTQRSPRQSFFYQGSSSPDLDWIPANEEEDTEDHSDSDTKDPNVSDSCSMSMEERSDTSEEPFSAETIDSMSEGESLTGVSVFVDRGNTSSTEDTVMHMDGGVSNGEDDEPDAQMEYECEWPSEDDCPERKTQAPIRFH